MQKLSLFLLLTLPALGKMPAYQEAGLNSYQAAAHLLGRFSYGATPGQVEAVAAQGLENWLEEQLSGRLDDRLCEQRLSALPALAMNNQQLQQTYLGNPELRKLASQAGMLNGKEDQADRKMLALYIKQSGVLTERELVRQLLTQKLIRGVHTQHQVREVMCDFWYNHFNVSRTTNPARGHILSYERDVIRPLALGSFRPLLGATARHPAMLLYLNNAQSMAPANATRLQPLPPRGFPGLQNEKKPMGLNENYARELMELHTLGVDGGYTQKDITEVAQLLTGWTTLGGGAGAQRAERYFSQNPNNVERGEYGFLFVPLLHDAGPKQVLGTAFPAGQGQAEGDRLLDLLSGHPKTSARLARKFAVRFVSDEPDPQLVKELDQVFRRSGGSSAAMLRFLINSPAFWSENARRAKVKSPLEYTLSSVRILGGEFVGQNEGQLPKWCENMGQNLYACVPPTGYPDKAEQWVSSGTLVHRVNFAFALVTGRVRGVRVHLPSPTQLEAVAAQILPGRSLQQALGPVRQTLGNQKFFEGLQSDPEGGVKLQLSAHQKTVGVLLSSPEFQRR